MHITAVSVDNFRCILCPFLYGGVGFKIAFGFCPVNDFFQIPWCYHGMKVKECCCGNIS